MKTRVDGVWLATVNSGMNMGNIGRYYFGLHHCLLFR